MIVRVYNRVDHADHLRSWLRARDKSEQIIDGLPAYGAIAFDGAEPIAAAFLRRAENEYGIFDGLITKPTADKKLRHIALDLVVENVIQKAKELGLKTIVAWTSDTGTLERSDRHGFKKLADTMIALDLTKRGE